MTVLVGVTSCSPQSKDLERQLDKADPEDDGIDEHTVLKNHQLQCDDTIQRTVNVSPSLKAVQNGGKVFREVTGSLDHVSVPSGGSAVVLNEGDVPNASNKCGGLNKVTKAGRAVSRGRRKSDNKDYDQKSQGSRRNRGRKISKSNRDYENSSSNGGNSGADGNGEDNGSDDDDEDDDVDEDDDDDDEDDDDDGEDDDDDDDEESKNEDDDDDISLNGNEKNVKSELKIKQEPDDQEMYPTGLQSFMAGLDGTNIPLADLLEKIPNSVCPGDESGSTPAAPGVPVTLHGIVCHEIGGVLVVNIKWRNKFYCGSLIDCSRHAWASPRFPAADGGENEMKLGGKGGHGKGKRRQKNNSMSSSVGTVKEATPLKHKLRGRKRGASGCPPPKSQGFKGMGKRRSKNMDDDDDGPRPGKRSCTMKTTVSPQPSPTLIECPEPGCDKKYKHINGLRYHQAHAHLEESNHSDERSASTSPSPVEEFKEPDTKPGFKGRTSRVSARARSISPSLAAAMASINEKKGDLFSRGAKKKDLAEPLSDSTATKEPKMSNSPIPALEEDSNMEDAGTTVVEISDKCQQACEHDIRKENSNQNSVEQAHTESRAAFKHSEELETAVKSLESEKVMAAEENGHPATSGPDTSSAVITGETSDAEKVGAKEPVQNSPEVWETVIDSGFSVAKGSTKSHNLVEDVEKALGENSFNGKQLDSQLCIPGVQPVDLRQAVDTGVGLINQLGIEVEDISENEEDIDIGQDLEYTSKDMTSPSNSAANDNETSCGESNSRAIPFVERGHCVKKPEMDSNKSLSSSDTLRTKLGSSFYFDVKKEDNSTEEKQNLKPEGKMFSECQSKRTELWIKTESSPLVSSQRSAETKPTSLEEKATKTPRAGISMEDLVSNSISRSAIEPPLINSDTPSMRYKYFECRNYGDDNYDKCIRTSDVDQKGIKDSKATLAPIRYPELVRNGANSEADLTCSNIKKASSTEDSRSSGKLTNKDLAVPAVTSRTRSPIPEVFSRNLNLSDKSRTSVESQSPSSSVTGSMTKHLSTSRSGFDASLQSPSSFLIAGSKVQSSVVERKTPSNPFQPVIVKHEFQSAGATKGIKQEVNSTGLNQSDSKPPLMSSVTELGKQIVEFKGRLGLSESSASRSPRPNQETEDYEKSYRLSRPHPTLISRNSGVLPPSLPVGVAHPYPRASDGGLASGHVKGTEHKTSASGSSVTSVTYSSTSPIPLPCPHDVSSELSQPDNKAKQLQTLQVPIPVGEVSPVSLKRSPGPAIHSGLPPVLPIIGPGIKTQGAASSHPVVRSGVKTSGTGEQIRNEKKSETSLRAPSPYGRSKSPASRPSAVPKPSPERKSPPPLASYHKARSSEDTLREDPDIAIVKEDPLAYGTGKDKAGVSEKERERRDAAVELHFRSQEPMSAEQLRNLQLQQQLTLQQYYQPFIQGGMSLEMIKNLSQMAYMQGMPVDPKATLAAQAQLFQSMPPEQQMQLMQIHRQMMLEQDKQGMRSSSSSSQPEARNFEKKEITKSSDRVQDERRSDESGAKKSPQGRLHPDISESEFRRFPVQAESLRYASRSLSPKVAHKMVSEEPLEKKSRLEDSYERERELERQKYKREEEFLQKQKLKQQISMYKQLESDLQKEQLGANFPRKRQITPEKTERVGNSREDERIENEARNTRDMIYHRAGQESATSTLKAGHHSFEAENSSGQGSPRSQVVKSQSLATSRSPRPTRSPVPTSRYKDSLDEREKRDGSSSLPANFRPTQFQAYLSQLNFDPSTGPLPYGAHQMLVGSQFSLPHGLVMSMPLTSHGESSTVTSVASSSREREERTPYRSTERDRSTTPTSHSNSQSRMPTSESHERLKRIKDAEKESRHSPVMFQEERARNRSATSEQNVSPKSSSRPSDLKAEESSSHGRQGIISNNLAISRMAGHVDALTEEELIRRQRFAAEYGDPSLHMNYYVRPGLIRVDPAYAANMMQSPPQHIGRGMEHYMTKRP